MSDRESNDLTMAEILGLPPALINMGNEGDRKDSHTSHDFADQSLAVHANSSGHDWNRNAALAGGGGGGGGIGQSSILVPGGGNRGGDGSSEKSDDGAGAFLEHNDIEDDYDFDEDKERTDFHLAQGWMSTKHRLYSIMEGSPFRRRDRWIAVTVNVVVLFAVLVSCVVFAIESLPYYYNRSGPQDGGNPLFWIETGCILIFILEAALRVYCAPWSALKNVFFLIDIISILAYFVDLSVDLSGAGSLSGFGAVRALRLLRVLRVFKLSRYSKSLQLVLVVLRSSASGLTILLVPLLLAIIVFATMLYFFEQIDQTWDPDAKVWREKGSNRPADFQTIPDSIWFCMVTVTTVGYGDLIPKTVAGRLIAVVVQFIGVLTLSFPNIVLGSNLQFAFKKYHQNLARKYFGKKFRKVRNILLFIRLAKEKVEETRRLRAEEREQAESDQVSFSDSESQMTMTATESLSMSEALQPAYNVSLSKEGIDDDGAAGKGGKRKKKKTNYFLTSHDFESVKKDDTPNIDVDNVRNWELHGVSAVTVLQRLLEGFSGVATVDDLYYTYRLESNESVSMRDLALTVIYLFQADYLQVFSFRQFSTKMLMSLTPAAVSELQLYPEEQVVECTRGADFARMAWRQTTGQNVPFMLQPLFACYPTWSSKEKYVDNTSDTLDFKTMYARSEVTTTTGTTGGGGGGSKRLKSVTVASLTPTAGNLQLNSAFAAAIAQDPPSSPLMGYHGGSRGGGDLQSSFNGAASQSINLLGPVPPGSGSTNLPPHSGIGASGGGGGVTLEDAKLQMKLLIQIQKREMEVIKANIEKITAENHQHQQATSSSQVPPLANGGAVGISASQQQLQELLNTYGGGNISNGHNNSASAVQDLVNGDNNRSLTATTSHGSSKTATPALTSLSPDPSGKMEKEGTNCYDPKQ